MPTLVQIIMIPCFNSLLSLSKWPIEWGTVAAACKTIDRFSKKKQDTIFFVYTATFGGVWTVRTGADIWARWAFQWPIHNTPFHNFHSYSFDMPQVSVIPSRTHSAALRSCWHISSHSRVVLYSLYRHRARSPPFPRCLLFSRPAHRGKKISLYIVYHNTI